MDLKRGVQALATQVFRDAYGYKPTKIRSLAGDPPSKKNSYLFNVGMMTYQGLLTAESGDMMFFIYFDAETKEWKYDFTAVDS